MKIEQDKELQIHAFDIFKHKELAVDEAYSKAKSFLDEKRNKDNLKIIPSDSIKIKAKTQIDCGRNFVVEFNCFKDNDFLLDDLRFVFLSNEDHNVKRVLEYVLEEVNKQLKIKGCITGSVEVILQHTW